MNFLHSHFSKGALACFCKRNTLGIYSTLVLLLVVLPDVVAQDPTFSQFYAQSLYLNPAFTGGNACPRLAMGYRNQWPGTSAGFNTQIVSYDQAAKNLNGGLGLMIMNDNQAEGTLRTFEASGLYAYHLPLKTVSISFGVQLTFRQRSLDWDRLVFEDQISPQQGFIFPTQEVNGSTKSTNVDVSAGGVISNKKFYAGFSAHHLTTPNERFLQEETSELSMRLNGHAGVKIPLDPASGNETLISPNIIWQQQGGFRELNLGMYLYTGPLVFGLWYRRTDALIALLGVETKYLKIGYSYDYTISRLGATGGAHEVSLQYTLPCRRRNPKRRPPVCHSF